MKFEQVKKVGYGKYIAVVLFIAVMISLGIMYILHKSGSAEDINKLKIRGIENLKKGDYDSAIRDYSDILDYEQDVMVYYNRGVAYLGKGEYPQAIADFSEAIKLNPENTSALNNRAIAYYYSGDYDESIKDYTAVLSANPKFGIAYLGRGNAFSMKGDSVRAATDYHKALSLGITAAKNKLLVLKQHQ